MPVDQLTMEFAASYRHYCACLMRTIAIGKANDTQRRMFEVTRDALAAMTEAARPGRPLGEIDDAHRRVYDEAGYGHARMAACGYSLGALYRPTWMDVPPMLYSGNPDAGRARHGALPARHPDRRAEATSPCRSATPSP